MRDDIRTRPEKLKKGINKPSGKKPVSGEAPDGSAEVEEVFLRPMLTCELTEKKRQQRRA